MELYNTSWHSDPQYAGIDEPCAQSIYSSCETHAFISKPVERSQRESALAPRIRSHRTDDSAPCCYDLTLGYQTGSDADREVFIQIGKWAALLSVVAGDEGALRINAAAASLVQGVAPQSSFCQTRTQYT
ncbi:hypothetical protein CAPTEDRAFT_185122, partial [Capitella teleta]